MPASKDVDAHWTVKGGHFHLGYKLHIRTDEEGFIEKVHVTDASAADVSHLKPLVDDVAAGVMVFVDKGYDSQANRNILKDRGLKDGIMRKAHRGHPLTEANKIRNKSLSKIRYRVEQSFATLHRKFRCIKSKGRCN